MVLCSDYDGTLRDTKNAKVLEENLKAVQQWRACNHSFVVVTGRNHSVIDSVFPGWQECVDYIIMDNGGCTYSCQNELVKQVELQPQYIDVLLAELQGQEIFRCIIRRKLLGFSMIGRRRLLS